MKKSASVYFVRGETLNRKVSMAKIMIEMEADEKELMSAVFDNLYQSWWLETDWDWRANDKEVVKVVEMTYNDFETEGGVTVTVTLEDILEAYTKVITGGYYHCGSKVTADWEEWDTCCSDIVLQMAIFKELMFA